SPDKLDLAVRDILSKVRTSGDAALIALTRKFDQVTIDQVVVPEDEILGAESSLDADLKSAIEAAATNIDKFHRVQKHDRNVIETMPGVRCWREAVAIDKIGI